MAHYVFCWSAIEIKGALGSKGCLGGDYTVNDHGSDPMLMENGSKA